MSEFLDPGLDYSTDELTEAEAAGYLNWCRRVHGEGDLELVPFAEFFVEYDPKGLKQLRRHTGALSLPIEAAVLMWTHTYCVQGFAKGVLYEVIAARELGVSKQEVVQVLRCAGYFGGPLALNAAGELTLPYLREWQAGNEEETVTWPPEWVVEDDPFASGIDHSITELLPGEFEKIRDWSESVYGEMPESWTLAAKYNPAGFKMSHVRFEGLTGNVLPPQLVALLALHTSSQMRWSTGVSRALALARFTGVDLETTAGVLHWSAAVGGEWLLDDGFAELSRSLNERPESK